jgi:hypothetical protein
MINKKSIWKVICTLIFLSFLISCETEAPDLPQYPHISRESKLPDDIEKQIPEKDLFPPILYSDEFEEPVPVPGLINTSGGEDSPFIMPDGKNFYFFFTPDVRVPAELQILDSVTGLYVSNFEGGKWQEARRVWLQEPDKLSLDGAACIQDNEMWFASAREGYTGVNNFIAEKVDGTWKNWTYAGDRIMKELRVGETHLHGDELYYHSDLEGGKGSFDIWRTTRQNGYWSDPVNISWVNTEGMDGWPYISSDGSEMWLTRNYMGTPALYRSQRVDGEWSEPELMVSQFAGEATLDDAGNLYFTHHFFEFGEMIEADIYVAYRK